MKKAKSKKVSAKRTTRSNKGALKIPDFTQSDVYRWADYFELQCLADKDRSIGKGEAFDLLELPLRDSLVNKEEFEGEDGTGYSLASFPQGKKDALRFFCDELFKMFEYRASIYGKTYPFKVASSDQLTLKPTVTTGQKLYIYLLACSNLNHFPEVQSKLTNEFEKIARESLRRILSPKTEVHHFGANIKPTRYTGKFFKKLQTLAEDLNCDLAAKEEDYSQHNSGDGGLDIVAWYPFKDLRWSRLIILAQCKCSDSWIDDRFSSSLDSWTGKIHFKQPINNFTFIPFCYRRVSGTWHSGPNVSGTILIDRQRLIDCLGDNVNFFNKYESIKFVVNRFFPAKK